MPQATDNMKCPTCHTLMQQGFVPVSGGIHFIRGDGRSASAFAEGLPGTNSIMRSNRLLAWRCKGCQLILFRYGRDNAKQLERELGLAEEFVEVEPEDESQDDASNPDKRRE